VILDELRAELAQHGPMLSEADQQLVVQMVAQFVNAHEVAANAKVTQVQGHLADVIFLCDVATTEAEKATNAHAAFVDDFTRLIAHQRTVYSRRDFPFDIGFCAALDLVASVLDAQ
jgi:phosphoribosylaminoimidazole carboxylase (NCAIR synthetase)